jgi:hypothetical protein
MITYGSFPGTLYYEIYALCDIASATHDIIGIHIIKNHSVYIAKELQLQHLKYFSHKLQRRIHDRRPLVLKSAIRMNNDLGISFNPLIKLVICNFRLIEANLMRDDEARPCFASDDQVAQLSIVRFYIALARAEGKALRLDRGLECVS